MEEDIETVIDRLQAFVAARKRVSVKEAASALAISANQIEKFASLLEESGLLRINYKVTGVELVSAEEAAKTDKEGKKPSGQRKSAVLEEAEVLEREVMTAKGVLEFLEKDLERRVQFVEALLKDLEGREITSQEELQKLRKEIAFILQQAAIFQEEVRKLEAKEDELSRIALEFNARLEALEARAAGLPLTTAPPQGIASFSDFIEALKKFFENLFAQKQPLPPTPPAIPALPAEAPPSQTVSEAKRFEEKIMKGGAAEAEEGKGEKGIKRIVSKITRKISKKR